MIVLDTCVISELTRPHPSQQVVEWLGRHRGGVLFLSAITIGELLRGCALLPAGARRRQLAQWLSALRESYADRILPIDESVAARWGEASASRRRLGRPLPAIDGLIAATAAHHGFHIATRNTADFADTGVTLVDPWRPA